MSHYIAIDIGGTQLRAACYPSDSIVPLKVNRISTKHPTQPALDRLYTLIESIWPEDEVVKGIGVAAPGPTDPHAGIIMEAPNIPGWEHLPLREYLQNRFGVQVSLGNDANLATLGEWQYGAGRGHHHVVYITISTGIGGGVIMEDHLLLGYKGLATELGHVTVLPDGPVCGCGRRGHLEAVASGPAITRWVCEELKRGVPSSLSKVSPLDARSVAAAAEAGDELAIAGLARGGTYLGEALANFLHIFNPSIVIFGGGVSRSGALIMDPIKAALQKHALPHYLENLTLTTALLGDDAGLMGALALAHTL